MTNQKEQVLVIPVAIASSIAPNAFNPIPADIADIERLIVKNHAFREREEAETNFAYKQVIPYILVTNTGTCVITESGGTVRPCYYLLTQRTSQQQEKRLHNKYSLGQGGHINDTDFRVHAGNGDRGPILNGLLREIKEEFTLTDVCECIPVALINDNTSEVSRVHMGIVYMMRVGSLEFKVAEQGKHAAQWATQAELPPFYDLMEPWSKLIYDHVIK
jgi:predicted NUDIX family phosphoesterase